MGRITHIVLYNIGIVGLLVRSVSSGIEIFDRYAVCFDVYFVVMSVVGFHYLTRMPSLRSFGLFSPQVTSKLLMLVFGISFFIQAYKFCKPLEKDIQMHYYWETHLPTFSEISTSYDAK